MNNQRVSDVVRSIVQKLILPFIVNLLISRLFAKTEDSKATKTGASIRPKAVSVLREVLALLRR